MLQGTIDEFPLIDVLGILQARNKTGRLEIERQAGRGLIYVRLGEPYYAESSLTRSLIGQKLVDIGAITDMQLRKALDRQAESGERLGQILLTHGVISGEHVAQAVISQIKDALADLLAWEAGEFRWETGAEVEVEVPLFGATAGSLGEGANPLAPHVIPVNTKEPETAPEQPAQPEAVAAQPDFPQGGTTMTGDEVTASPIASFPDAGQDQSLEVVHSSPEVVDDTEDEEESIIDTWDEAEQEFETQPEPGPEPVLVPVSPAPFHAPLVIRSQPAPELDEEFEAVFEANAHASFEVEPVTEPVAQAPSFDPPPLTDPGFGVDAFTPIAPVTDSEQPIFEPENANTDPIFDSANFEPVAETFEPTLEPTNFESVAGVDSMPVAPSPPPPVDASEAEATEGTPAPAEAPASPPDGVAPESLKDIKLDRSSLVRELSDLLR